jgi:hypothetical protein
MSMFAMEGRDHGSEAWREGGENPFVRAGRLGESIEALWDAYDRFERGRRLERGPRSRACAEAIAALVNASSPERYAAELVAVLNDAVERVTAACVALEGEAGGTAQRDKDVCPCLIVVAECMRSSVEPADAVRTEAALRAAFDTGASVAQVDALNALSRLCNFVEDAPAVVTEWSGRVMHLLEHPEQIPGCHAAIQVVSEIANLGGVDTFLLHAVVSLHAILANPAAPHSLKPPAIEAVAGVALGIGEAFRPLTESTLACLTAAQRAALAIEVVDDDDEVADGVESLCTALVSAYKSIIRAYNVPALIDHVGDLEPFAPAMVDFARDVSKRHIDKLSDAVDELDIAELGAVLVECARLLGDLLSVLPRDTMRPLCQARMPWVEALLDATLSVEDVERRIGVHPGEHQPASEWLRSKLSK